jgi:hypothetical protein
MVKWCAAGFALLLLVAGAVVWTSGHWTYSDGQRTGYVQNLSRRGVGCKTWEGELAMVSTPGTITERFHFTVPADAVAKELSASVGKMVAVHYQQHKWKLNSCQGDTQYDVTGFRAIP